MAILPYNRVVNVTLSRNDAFPSRRGFGTELILTTVAVTGKVDATHRTKLYASIDEVAADFATTADAYKAALSAFSQNPRPRLARRSRAGEGRPGDTFAASIRRRSPAPSSLSRPARRPASRGGSLRRN